MLMVENYLFWLRIAETSTWRCNLLSLRINQAIWPWDKCECFFSPHAAWRQHRLLPVAPPTCSSPPCPLFWHRDSVWEGVWFRISMFRPLFLHVFPFCHRFVCVCVRSRMVMGVSSGTAAPVCEHGSPSVYGVWGPFIATAHTLNTSAECGFKAHRSLLPQPGRSRGRDDCIEEGLTLDQVLSSILLWRMEM